MNVVVLYGPPAAGKLTVARELSKITGMKLFHNHLTTNAARSIFPISKKEEIELHRKLRLVCFDAAAREKVDLIFTYCYAGKKSDSFVKKMLNVVGKRGGKVKFVQLSCDEEELHKRVINGERKKLGKINCAKLLKNKLKKINFLQSIPVKENLIINNTKFSAKLVAKKIKNHFKL